MGLRHRQSVITLRYSLWYLRSGPEILHVVMDDMEFGTDGWILSPKTDLIILFSYFIFRGSWSNDGRC